MTDAGPTTVTTSTITLGAVEAAAKPLLASRTLWALVVTVIAWGANKAGAHITDATTSQIVDLVTTIMQGGGITAAALFRVVASTSLK